MAELTILAPTGFLGAGFDRRAFERSMERRPAVIAVDAGSTDPGPYYLGAGKPLHGELPVGRDTEILLRAALDHRIPLIIGSAGTGGGEPHLRWMVDLLHRLARKAGRSFTMGILQAEVDKAFLKRALAEGRVRDFEAGRDLTPGDIDGAARIVAQMGHQPLVRALETGVEVIVAGRSCDEAPFAAVPIARGYDPGLALHMGKILECGAFASVPYGMDCMLGTLDDDGFVLEPGNPARACTVQAVAGHTLYEREDPSMLHCPGGAVDIRGCQFIQLDGRRVRVRGSRFQPAEACWIKLEGVRRVGYRSLSVGGIRCPSLVARIEQALTDVRKKVEDFFAGSEPFTLTFHVYGRDGVMGHREPLRQAVGHEVGLVIDAVAGTQGLAHDVCRRAVSVLMHYSYEGMYNTAGNLALLTSPSETDAGEVFEFTIYHLLRVDDPCGLFRFGTVVVGR